MRPIKFRAFNEDTKKMELLNNWFIKDWILDIWTPIMQFTWLLDKNGKEIFEGDIVRLDHFTSDHSETIVLPIVFRDSWFVAYEQWMWGEKFYPMFTEVIWNIYENPELLN